MSRPTIGVGGVILDGERICLIKRAHPPLRNVWTLPGGKLERGENLRDAVRREVKEETGLEVEVGALIEAVEIIDDDHHYVVLDYRCRIVGGELAAGDDASDAKMVAVADLDAYEVSEAVRRVVKKSL